MRPMLIVLGTVLLAAAPLAGQQADTTAARRLAALLARHDSVRLVTDSGSVVVRRPTVQRDAVHWPQVAGVPLDRVREIQVLTGGAGRGAATGTAIGMATGALIGLVAGLACLDSDGFISCGGGEAAAITFLGAAGGATLGLVVGAAIGAAGGTRWRSVYARP